MVTNKHISKIIVVLMTIAVALCFAATVYSEQLTEYFGGTGVSMEYESKLFNTDELISIDIQMDEDDWKAMLSNPLLEEYYVCDVVINGQRINNVGIRPKGNTSLSAIAMDPDNNRYSFKLEFNHFVEGQTCFGLDKLILNNNYADATNMKEAIIYDMYQFIGADASLYNYAEINVNGEYWGVYLALEAVEQSFMLRNYGTQDGELYKPDSMEMGGNSSSDSSSKPSFDGMTPPSNNFLGGQRPAENERPSNSDLPDDSSDFKPDNKSSNDEGSDSGGGRPNMGGGFTMGRGGANLNYIDDELDSYSTIWEGEITGTGNKDHRRVVTALKNISEGNNLEKYLDIENVLKYMAVHTFAVNMDSLSGSMAHNYYLYEYDGQLNIIPWDYNLSFGGMSMGSSGDATEMVNDAIDTPFSGTQFFDALLENEEYLVIYHKYLQQLVEEYVNNGKFDKVYNRIRNQIDELVKTDPNALYDYQEYETAAELLNETIKLRAQSIEGQLNGTIPSTDDGQRKDSSNLIDASHIDTTLMGQFNMGGFKDNRKGRRDKSDDSSSSSEDFSFSGIGDFFGGGMPDFNPENMPGDGFNPSDGNMPDMNSFGSQAMTQNSFSNSKLTTLAVYGLCLAFMLIMIISLKLIKRRI